MLSSPSSSSSIVSQSIFADTANPHSFWTPAKLSASSWSFLAIRASRSNRCSASRAPLAACR
jgi:hypothetical protein